MAFRPDYSPILAAGASQGQGLAALGSGISSYLGQKREDQKIAEQKALAEQKTAGLKSLYDQALGGNVEAQNQLAFEAPKINAQVMEMLGAKEESQQKGMIADAANVISLHQAGDKDQALNLFNKRIEAIESRGGDASDTIEIRDAYEKNPEIGIRVLKSGLQAMLSPEDYVGQLNKPAKEAEKTKYQQGSGDMAGYSFNPDTGEYSVNENIKTKLEEAKSLPVLDAKTRQGINKDLTQLTKDTKMIVNTAKDLEKLSQIKSGPASIAMVFKFMKALDPTSVVREGEFATAENSAGVPESVRNIYNKVMEGERLGDKQASQFVNTAKQLANTAIESSTGEVQSFVDTFEDTLTENFKKSLLKRVPKAFNIKPQGSTGIIIKAHPTYGDVTEDDIKTTMAQSGMTREQVLSKLGG